MNNIDAEGGILLGVAPDGHLSEGTVSLRLWQRSVNLVCSRSPKRPRWQSIRVNAPRTCSAPDLPTPVPCRA
jgi:hypothetical protein